jgi:arsenate reductase (thioredoxin)
MTEAAPAPAGAPKPSRNLFAGRWDALRTQVRDWLKLDDPDQVGIRVKHRIRRERHTQLRIMFVDVGNSARSQVAQALALMEGFHAESAGTFPSTKVQPEAVHAMKELGLDISGFRPKPLDVGRLDSFDFVVSFGDALPRPWRTKANCQVWTTVDPIGLPYAAYREMRKDLQRRLRRLARQHKVRPRAEIPLPAPAQG